MRKGLVWAHSSRSVRHDREAVAAAVGGNQPGTLLLIPLPPVYPAQEPRTGTGASHFRGGSSHLSQHSHSQLNPSHRPSG